MASSRDGYLPLLSPKNNVSLSKKAVELIFGNVILKAAVVDSFLIPLAAVPKDLSHQANAGQSAATEPTLAAMDSHAHGQYH